MYHSKVPSMPFIDRINTFHCDVWGCHSVANEDYGLLGCDTV